MARRRSTGTSSPRNCWRRARRSRRTGWRTARSAPPCCASAPRSSGGGSCRGSRAGEVYFGIGMSEPDSGSDLASVRTKAEKVDGGWELTGTKVWTSGAHRAHAFFALARTAPRDEDHRHAGLSPVHRGAAQPRRDDPADPTAHRRAPLQRGRVRPRVRARRDGARRDRRPDGTRSRASSPSSAAGPSGSSRRTRCSPRSSGSWAGRRTKARAAPSARWWRGCGRCGGCRWPLPVPSIPARRPSSRLLSSRTSAPASRTRSSTWRGCSSPSRPTRVLSRGSPGCSPTPSCTPPASRCAAGTNEVLRGIVARGLGLR